MVGYAHRMTLKPTTLVFLVKRAENSLISDLCLAYKKRGFGTGRFNGIGGKAEPGETIEQCAIRETKEEIGVEIKTFTKCAELTFFYQVKPEWDQLVSVFLCESWEGEPTESEEMRPQWFTAESIPFSEMWPDDIFWLPPVLEGKAVKGTFSFGEGDVILSKEVHIIEANALNTN